LTPFLTLLYPFRAQDSTQGIVQHQLTNETPRIRKEKPGYFITV
jgi:hypothetical protein